MWCVFRNTESDCRSRPGFVWTSVVRLFTYFAFWTLKMIYERFMKGSLDWYEICGTFSGLGRGFRTFIRLEWTLLEVPGLEWILREIHRAGMDFPGDSPGWNDFTRRITGLLRIFVEIHWLIWIYSKNHRAVTDFRGDSPGWNGPNVKVHRAVMNLIKVHRAVMDLIVESPGCYGFTP